MNLRDDAYKDYKAGMKNKEIADKHGVSVSTVRSWVNRYWKHESVATIATKIEENVAKKTKSVATQIPKKRGPPKGNQNAVGNTNAGPVGQKNALTHGAYERIMLSMLDEDEKEIFNESFYDDTIDTLREEYALLCAREVRITKRILDIKTQSKNAIILDSVTVTQTIKRTGEFSKDEKGKFNKKDNTGFFDGEFEESTETNTTSNLDALNKLEAALDRIHNQKVRLLMNIEKIQNDRVRIEILKQHSENEQGGNEAVDDWVSAVEESFRDE